MVSKQCIQYDLAIFYIPFNPLYALSFLLLSPYCRTMSPQLPSLTFALKSPITRITSPSLHYRFAVVISLTNLSLYSSALSFAGAYIIIMLMLNILPFNLTKWPDNSQVPPVEQGRLERAGQLTGLHWRSSAFRR